MRSDNNVVDRCAYRVVWCPTYRRSVVTAERECTIVKLETMPDHGHLRGECDPKYKIHQLVRQIKERSSRVPRQEFPSPTSRFPMLWANSYVVATVGGSPLGSC
ncbi:IS200/IS605 family transposase [Corynebacterium hylobatis]|uniref:IS200/IS605 family transposase n=1 Tax=Corynebacterium hylobatis TaxID=1859290 RepID=A0A3R9ZJW3_9CORY|nr:IS200/IS605 family transposase [Corynebacterium hylobatis]RSZ64481.1 IS200/IS605 family transposase [Corynebacterium hylobatis]